MRVSTVIAKRPHPPTAHMKINKILVPTDFSPASKEGIRYALNLAHAFDAEVIVYHVIGIKDIVALTRNLNEAKLEAARVSGLKGIFASRLRHFLETNFREYMTSVKTIRKVEFGTPEKGIVETAKAEEADLIVIAGGGRGRFAAMFFGSVTEKVIRDATCPVVTVPAEFMAMTDVDARKAVA